MTPKMTVISSSDGNYVNNTNDFVLVVSISQTADLSVISAGATAGTSGTTVGFFFDAASDVDVPPKQVILLPPNFILSAGEGDFSALVLVGSLEDLRGYF